MTKEELEQALEQALKALTTIRDMQVKEPGLLLRQDTYATASSTILAINKFKADSAANRDTLGSLVVSKDFQTGSCTVYDIHHNEAFLGTCYVQPDEGDQIRYLLHYQTDKPERVFTYEEVQTAVRLHHEAQPK